MKLSVGMIVKNEQKYLERCLIALQPVLDNIESELIITDTGSTDNTVGIAEKYANKVLHFAWTGNFSDARNTALSEAKGDWFMFLDADELFGSCDDLIEFFNSGEYHKYNSASVIIRNIYDENNLSDYTLFNAARLTKRTDSTEFVGAVHETLNTYGAPVKKLNSYINHFGYAVSDRDNLRKKFERNYELLISKYNTSKDKEPLVFSQLYDCCITGERFEEADKFLDEGISWAKAHNNIILAVFYCKKAYRLLADKRYDEALSVCIEHFGMDKKLRPGKLTSDAEILAIQGTALYELARYDEAFTVFRNFFNVFSDVKTGKINTAESFMIDFTASSDRNYIKYVCSYLTCSIKSSSADERAALIFTSSLPLSEYCEDPVWVKHLASVSMQIMEKTGFENCTPLYRKLNDHGKNAFLSKLRQTVFYSQNKIAAIKALHEISGSDPGISAVADIYGRYFSGEDIPITDIVDIMQKYGAGNNADLLMIAMDKGLDISGILTLDSFDPADTASQGYKCFYGFHKAADNYDISLISDPRALRNAAKFWESCMGCTVGFKSPKPNVYLIINANRLVEKFGLIGERISTEIKEPDDDCMNAAVLMGGSLVCRRNRNYKLCIENMKKAVQLRASLAPFISEYSKEVINEYNELANDPANEMQMLIGKIKNNIKAFIASGNIAAAQKTLDEFRKIAPNDVDIVGLQSEIDRLS